MTGEVYCWLSVSARYCLYLYIAFSFALLFHPQNAGTRISPNFLFAKSFYLASVLCLSWLNVCNKDSKAGIYLPGTFYAAVFTAHCSYCAYHWEVLFCVAVLSRLYVSNFTLLPAQIV
jgi:hypothetical protein